MPRLLLAMILSLMLLAGRAWAEKPRLLILQFAPLGTNDNDAWTGRAINDSLTAELGRSQVEIVPASKEMPLLARGAAPLMLDWRGAVKIGEKANADYVIFGTYQVVRSEIRATGEVFHV